MMLNPRGPYSRILWYCNDGTTQSPVAYACSERGGGKQHAEYSAQRNRLAELGWSVGTIFAAENFAGMLDSQPREQRFRELALERYLVDTDDGWVLRRAQTYRGRVQVEDEIVAGQAILLDALSDWNWAGDRYLLMRELVRVVPHGQETDLSRRVRREAVELAERFAGAEVWRVEIHTAPSSTTADRLRGWARGVDEAEVAALANSLSDDLDQLYGASGRRARLHNQLGRLGPTPQATDWRDDVVRHLDAVPYDRVLGLCAASDRARASLLATLEPLHRLSLLDSLAGLDTEVRLSFGEMRAERELPRADLISLTRALLNCAYGSGLVSDRERTSAAAALNFAGDARVALARYENGLSQLRRVPGWAAGTVRYTFAEALVDYVALDARAVRFTDDLLRGSPVWMLGDVLRVLNRDLSTLTGSEVEIAGQKIDTAIALNPGIARGRLRIFETIDAAESANIASSDIVVLPETIAELQPVAGILTLGEGNALSHVQLLARNFGIPNVAVDMETIDLIRPLAGRDVILVASSSGDVILRSADEAAGVAHLLSAAQRSGDEVRITVPAPDLELVDILHLADIRREMSGRIIGPKAANLGELNQMFPRRIAPALAIPFGIYAAHMEHSGLMPRIRSAYAALARGDMSRQELDAELAQVRAAVAALSLMPETRAQLTEAMEREFGEPGSYGVFIRSDTNVEDLPQFTGAGLSETIPNVVDLDAQLASIPRVWASVLSPRALAWRSSLLTNPEQIFASVLLMQSVPSEKSGVLVTANLMTPNEPGLTVSTAWGVGGAVAGEAAEGVVVTPAGQTVLMSEAKAPYQRRIAATGGVEWLPAVSGAVLTNSDIVQLRELAAEVDRMLEPVTDEHGRKRPWDIEFGFVEGELTLFQIRPLVERSNERATQIISTLRPAGGTRSTTGVSVDMTSLPER